MTKVTEAIIIHTRKVACDGGNEPLGHPKVFLEINPNKNEVFCPYCGRHFIYREPVGEKSKNE